MKQTPNAVVFENDGRARDGRRRDSVKDVGNESQETLYDKDVLAYCWKISEEASNIPSRRNDQPVSKSAERLVSSRSKRRSLRSRVPAEVKDRKMSEHCLRLSGSASLKSVRDKDSIRSTRIRHTSAARSMSEASISGPEISQLRFHDSGHIVFPSQGGRSSRRASIR